MFTSNVDNHFLKAGFPEDRILECHGSIFHFQCAKCGTIEERREETFELDTAKFESKHVPCCSSCQSPARPNILMFGDWDWISDRTDQQESRFHKWLHESKAKKLAIVEIGAGNAVPTVRYQSEQVLRSHRNQSCHLIRINPYE